jgi:rhodanese-related sulfurtransferase/CBS domain-containing protein
MKTIDTHGLQALIEQGAQLVEVLPASAYEQEHLPGAINIPLPDVREETVATLDRDRPVVVYCYDLQCDLSPRGAVLLEAMGFEQVYDYAESKVAWLAYGLPAEGSVRPTARAGAIARTNAVTCRIDDRVGDLTERMQDERLAVVLCTTDAGDVVVGVVRDDVLALPGETAVADVLQPAPPSVRPSITIAELAKSMDKSGESWVLVTHLDGTFIGVAWREDLDGQH